MSSRDLVRLEQHVDSPYLREVDATWQKASRMEVEQQFQNSAKLN